MFKNCTSLKSITIPSSVTSIDWGGFEGCTSLTSVTISDGVTMIGGGMFKGCTSLKSITIPSSVTEIGDWSFEETVLTSLTIPEGVTYIGNGAFQDLTSLKSITIPSSVTYLGEGAVFWNWTSSQTINIRGHASWAEADAAWGDWLGNCAAVIKFWNGNSYVEPVGTLEFELINGGTAYSVSKGTVRDGAVVIPPTYNNLPVTHIAVDAFNSTRITSVTIPSSVTEIGYMAFGWCYGITSITIPDSVEFIGNYAFSCIDLTSVNIPASVTYINGNPFSGCRKLTNLTVAANNPSYTSEDRVLYNKGKTKIIAHPTASGSITIPSSVREIGIDAFRYSTITSVTIPANVTEIGWGAFYACTSLTKVTFATGSIYVDDLAFPEGSDEGGGTGGNMLRTAYEISGPGTYTRATNGDVWTKQ